MVITDDNRVVNLNLKVSYLLRQLVKQIHCPIRIYDLENKPNGIYGLSEEIQDVFATDPDFLDQLLKYTWQDCPHLFYEEENICEAVLTAKDGYTVIVGPVSFLPVTGSAMQRFQERHKIPEGQNYELCYCKREFFVSGLLILAHVMTGAELTVDDLWSKNFGDSEMKFEHEQQLVENAIRSRDLIHPHVPYTIERREMMAIAAGDLSEFKQAVADEEMHDTIGMGQEDLRHCKNLAIGKISLACRTALDINVGVAEEDAFNINDSYIQIVESMNTPEKIEHAMREAEVRFLELVRDEKKKQELPHPLVRKVRDYILRNLQSDIKVSDMAENLGVNADYLSYLFHKNTGKTISRYILEEKVKAAQSMLRYTDNSLQEIAFVLNFSSQSHFSTVFKKFNGMTPREYRELNKPSDV